MTLKRCFFFSFLNLFFLQMLVPRGSLRSAPVWVLFSFHPLSTFQHLPFHSLCTDVFRAWFYVQTEQWVLVTQANKLVRQHWTRQTILTGKKNTTQNTSSSTTRMLRPCFTESRGILTSFQVQKFSLSVLYLAEQDVQLGRRN